MVCPITKKHCDDEVCSPNSECNLSGDQSAFKPHSSSAVVLTSEDIEQIETILSIKEDSIAGAHKQQYIQRLYDWYLNSLSYASQFREGQQGAGVGAASFHEQDDTMYCSHCNRPLAEPSKEQGEEIDEHTLIDWAINNDIVWNGTSWSQKQDDGAVKFYNKTTLSNLYKSLHPSKESPREQELKKVIKDLILIIENLLDAAGRTYDATEYPADGTSVIETSAKVTADLLAKLKEKLNLNDAG